MSEQDPIRDELDVPFDADAQKRVHDRLRRSMRRSPSRRATLSIAAAAAVAITAIGYGTYEWATAPAVFGPLVDVQGATRFDRADAAEAPRVVLFDDDSSITLSRGTNIEAISNTGQEVHLVMSDGLATFDITPDGPRRWVIDARGVTVDVLGTEFSVEHNTAFIEIRVSRGLVRVRGQRVPEGVRRLGPGESLRIEEEVAGAPAAVDVRDPATDVALDADTSRPGRWRANVQSGEYRAAYRELQARGFRREVAAAQSAETLLLLADAARLSGHPRQARSPLRRLIRSYPRDSRASVAAFTLGRIQLESLNQPDQALRSFEQAVELGLPPSLERAAELRIREARAASAED